jgi:hypothetical protein
MTSMSSDRIDEAVIVNSLTKILSKESGLFGHEPTWGATKEPYELIGYELSEDFVPTLESMTENQRKNFFSVMSYFEIHAKPLKEILLALQSKGNNIDTIFYELAWSHFMTIVMFGMLEVVVKISPQAIQNKHGNFIKKQESIRSFLLENTPIEKQKDIAQRYYVEPLFSSKKVASFSDVIDHLWEEIRSGFVHDGGLQSKGLGWTTFSGGMGTKNDPIKVHTDVPVAELLQITWQAILNSYGYKGELKPHKYKR